MYVSQGGLLIKLYGYQKGDVRGMDKHGDDHYYFIYEKPGNYNFCNSDGRIVGWILVIFAVLLIIFSI